MSLHLLDLRSIKDLAPLERADHPVSITLQPDGTPLVVSAPLDAALARVLETLPR